MPFKQNNMSNKTGIFVWKCAYFTKACYTTAINHVYVILNLNTHHACT